MIRLRVFSSRTAITVKVFGSLAATLLVAGCGSNEDDQSSPSATVTVTETVTVAAEPSSVAEASSSPTESDDSPASTASDVPSFQDGVLLTADIRIEILRHKVIKPGEKGNEYGDKPVIAFWYDTTNLSGAEVDPTDFLFHFTAYQDNNPNAVNELEVGSLPDDRFLDTQLENIKEGGTVENAVAYELDDLTTPVDLVAAESLLDDPLGTMSYSIK